MLFYLKPYCSQGRLCWDAYGTTTSAPPLPCCPGTNVCGRCGVEKTRRVIGGVETAAGVYPWIAALGTIPASGLSRSNIFLLLGFTAGRTYLAPIIERPELMSSTSVGEPLTWLVRRRNATGSSIFVTGVEIDECARF